MGCNPTCKCSGDVFFEESSPVNAYSNMEVIMGGASVVGEAVHQFKYYFTTHSPLNCACIPLAVEALARSVYHVALGMIGSISSEVQNPTQHFKDAAIDLIYGTVFAFGSLNYWGGYFVSIGVVLDKAYRDEGEAILDRYLVSDVGLGIVLPGIQRVFSYVQQGLESLFGVTVVVQTVAAGIITGLGLLLVGGMILLGVGFTAQVL